MDIELKNKKQELASDTKLVVSGRTPINHHGFINTPVHRGSSVLFPTVKQLEERSLPYEYARHGSPSSSEFEDALKSIDGSAGVVLCPSGLAAISLALLSCLKSGDHLLMTDSVYGPARKLCESVLNRYGVETTFYDPLIGQELKDLIKPNTRAVYFESPGSYTGEIQDVPTLVSVAREFDLITLMDNTWATPLFFNAIEHGVDLVVQSGTKYIVGHSDAMLGIVSSSEKCWPTLKTSHRELGQYVSPDDIFLAARGLRTLGLRLKQHQQNATAIARWLLERPEVSDVLYPALKSDKGHTIWKRDFSGSSSIISIILKPCSATDVSRFLEALELFSLGYSWGGYSSLVVPFGKPVRAVNQWNPHGHSIRFHIGLEDSDDLIDDLRNAFNKLRCI